jgi:hypothetical protein
MLQCRAKEGRSKIASAAVINLDLPTGGGRPGNFVARFVAKVSQYAPGKRKFRAEG